MKHCRKKKSIVRLPNSSGFAANMGSTCEAQSAEPLFKGTREEIRLVGIYPLKKHKFLYAYAYGGERKADGTKKLVSISTEETDPAKAKIKGEEFVIALRKQWDQKYGTNGGNPRAQGSQPVAPPEGCIEQQIVERLDMKLAELGKDSRTLIAYLSAGNFVLDFLGPKRARGRWEMLSDQVIVRLKEARLRSLDPNTDSPWQNINMIRFLVDGLPGFKAEWLKILKVPKGTRGWIRDKKSDEFPFLLSELQLVDANLSRASETAQGLHYFGIAGLMHSGDAALTRWEQFDQAVEAIAEGRRLKNGNPFRYGIWPELQTWLERRKREPGDIYIFPELTFTQKQLKVPDCNKKRLSRKQERSSGIKTRVCEAYREFLLLCGITREGVSFRSYRSFNSSELFAAGYQVPLLKAVTGHNTDEAFFKYVHILPRHIGRLAESHRKQYLALVAGKPLPVYLTHTEVVEALTSVAEETKVELQGFVARSLESLGGQLKVNVGDFIARALSEMGQNIVSAFSQALGGQIQRRSDGSAVIELPGVRLPESFAQPDLREGAPDSSAVVAEHQLTLALAQRSLN